MPPPLFFFLLCISCCYHDLHLPNQMHHLAARCIQQHSLYVVAGDTIPRGISQRWHAGRSKVSPAAARSPAGSSCGTPALSQPVSWGSSSSIACNQPVCLMPAILAPETRQEGVRENPLLKTTWNSRTTQNQLPEEQRVHAFIPNGLCNPIPIHDSVVYGHNMFISWEQTCSVLEGFPARDCGVNLEDGILPKQSLLNQ